MSYVNEKDDAFNGIAGESYELELSPQYTLNEITIVDGSGRITIEAKSSANTEYEEVVDGTLVLSIHKTLVIDGYKLKAIRLTQNETQAFTVIVTQRNPEQVSA